MRNPAQRLCKLTEYVTDPTAGVKATPCVTPLFHVYVAAPDAVSVTEVPAQTD